jgi:hypothetical protein
MTFFGGLDKGFSQHRIEGMRSEPAKYDGELEVACTAIREPP